ncbi:PvdJ(3) [Pseudomonas aeruginosa]|nr:PvdJ(3) [Pseudomonas aeruginosa]
MARIEEEVRVPFDLERGPLLRVLLLRLSAEEQVLVVTLHHIVSDGWSTPIMVEELMQFYAGYREGRAVELEPLPIQYADYACGSAAGWKPASVSANWPTGGSSWAASSRCWNCRPTGRGRAYRVLPATACRWSWAKTWVAR